MRDEDHDAAYREFFAERGRGSAPDAGRQTTIGLVMLLSMIAMICVLVWAGCSCGGAHP